MPSSNSIQSKTLAIYKVDVTNASVSKVQVKTILSKIIGLQDLYQGINLPKIDEKLQGA